VTVGESSAAPAVSAEIPPPSVTLLIDEDAEEENTDQFLIGSRKRKLVTEDPVEGSQATEVPLVRTETEIPPVKVPSKKKVVHKPAPAAGAGRRKKRDLASLQLNLGQDAFLVKKAHLARGELLRM